MNGLNSAGLLIASGLVRILPRVFYWLLVILPGTPYLFLSAAYGRILKYKRFKMQGLIDQPRVLDTYVINFGKVGDKKEDLVDELFALHYNWWAYGLAVIFNMLVIAAAVAIAFVQGGIPLGLPAELKFYVLRAPAALTIAMAGAYVLNLYDVLRRYRTNDLSPSSLHFTWLHMIVAAFLGPLLSQAFVPAVALPVAFGVGVFPLKDSLDTVMNLAKKKLEITSTAQPCEPPTLQKLQGLTGEIIDRLDEEGLTSTVHVAYADPIRLLLRTNIEWAVIIDIIDQALLFNYVGDRIEQLRPIGIRGGIELATIGRELLASTSDADKQRGQAAAAAIAARLGQTQDEVRGLIQTCWEDAQVALIWALLGETLEPSTAAVAAIQPSAEAAVLP